MKTKLVPIDADLAGRAAAAGKKSGRGYYATVNDLLRSALNAPPAPGPSVYDALAMAEATIERLTVHHGPFTSTQGTLDVIRAARTAADLTPGDGETAKVILRDVLRNFPGFITDDDVNGGDLVEYLNCCMVDVENAIGGAPVLQELSVCADCVEVVEHGEEKQNDLDADRMGEILVAIRALLEKNPGAHLIAGGETDDHSRRACQLCGSKLHGSRHAVTLFKA